MSVKAAEFITILAAFALMPGPHFVTIFPAANDAKLSVHSNFIVVRQHLRV
jgi:hypothetical protein